MCIIFKFIQIDLWDFLFAEVANVQKYHISLRYKAISFSKRKWFVQVRPFGEYAYN